MNQSSSPDCSSTEYTRSEQMDQESSDISFEHTNISPMSYGRTAPRSVTGQTKIVSPPPGLYPGSFPPPRIDTSMPPPLYPNSFNNSQYPSSNLPFDPFRPPPSFRQHEPVIGSYPSMHTENVSQTPPLLSTQGGSEASNAINIPQSAIPHHMTNDPTIFLGQGKSGSSAPNPGSSPMMSFSPSKIPSHTLTKFSQDESSGVPLQTPWTFWLDRSSNNFSLSEYKASLKKIYTVSTVQGFWSVYHHIPDVWEVRLRTYYHLMREEREPLWEDPTLAHGGVWRIKCPKKDTPRVWKELLLAAIGEQFIDDVCKGDDICGLSVSPREKDDLLQIWNIQSEAVEESRVMEKVHKLLPDVRFNAEFYKPHQTHSAFEGAKY